MYVVLFGVINLTSSFAYGDVGSNSSCVTLICKCRIMYNAYVLKLKHRTKQYVSNVELLKVSH